MQGKCPALKKASKKIYPEFSSEYDLWLDRIKIEVKASRAVDNTSDEPIYIKALARTTQKKLLMNFQQLKLQCCDVFIWVAVFRDKIVLLVMNSDEVLHNPLYSKGQHRGNRGNEGQLHIKDDSIQVLKKFELIEDDFGQTIRGGRISRWCLNGSCFSTWLCASVTVVRHVQPRSWLTMIILQFNDTATRMHRRSWFQVKSSFGKNRIEGNQV